MSEVRDNAVHCEAKKHAYRQTQDGVVVSFVLHPQEVPDGLAISSLGTRYMIALVEIGDDEKPKEVMPPGLSKDAHRTKPETRPRAEADNATRGTKKLTMRIAILCQDPVFQQFLAEEYEIEKGEHTAADFVRDKCRVASRKDIAGTDAQVQWQNLYTEFQAWNYGPNCGAN